MKSFLLRLCCLVILLVLAPNADAAVSFVQVNSATPQSSQASVPVAFTSAQSAGNLNVVVVGWNDTTASVNSVTDTKGNVYTLAVGPTALAGALSQSIYYAKNIVAATANGNTVTVQFNTPAAYADIRIAEYSGMDTVSPVDVTAAATGNSATSSTNSVTTSNANDLLFGANMVATLTKSQGANFTKRLITKPDGDLVEDRIVTTTGSYNATATLTPGGAWVMQMVAFKAAGAVPVGPSVTINQTSGQADPTNASPINFTAVFSAPVTGFIGSDVTIGGTAGGSRSAVVTGSGTTYNVAVSGMTTNGTVAVSIPANAAQDAASNGNSASTSTDNTVTYTTTGPTVTINQASGQADPTNASTINFTAVFSSAVTGFTGSDVTIGGTSGGSRSALVTGSGTTYNVAVSGMTNGTVTVSIPANSALDTVGNGNSASTSTDNTVTYTTTGPTVTINQASGQADPASASPINFTAVFSAPVTGFIGSDVTIGGTSGGTRSAVVTGSGTTYNVAVSGMTTSGTVTVLVPAGSAVDTVGNANSASTSTDNTVTYNATGPTVTINQASGQADPTNTGPINFTAVFSASVTGFTASDVSVGGTAGGSAAVTGSGTTYNVAITGMTSNGTVTVSIPANAAQNGQGLGNSASTSTDNTVTYSTVGPTVTINQASGQIDPTSASPINFTAVFSSSVTGFTASDVSVGGTAGGSAAVTGSGATYNVAVSGMASSGTVTVSIPANAAQNTAGNGNSASTSTDNTVTYTAVPADTTPPDVHIDTPLDGAQVSSIIAITADAEDDVAVAGVQFIVDGVDTGAEDTTEPYAYSWDTRSAPNGAHTLTARARDTSGNTAVSAPIIVNVANSDAIQNEILATGFTLPTCITFLPDGRMLLVELAGRIKVLPPPYVTPDPTLFLQLSNVGSAGVQQGVYNICLDPAFAANHYYYIYYTAGSPNRDRLSRLTANPALNGTVAGSELILYQDPQNANAEHHGGSINFGNDGMLYFTTGEHFDAAVSQDLSNPRGKIHRIHSDGTVPTDNPFYDGSGPNWDSVWALGLRNPFRASYDAPTDRLIIGDVGGNDYSTAKEEVDIGARGANYGWPNSEGLCSGTCTDPIYFWPHNGRDSCVVGGFVYHGTQFPAAFEGSYFFADYTQNWIRRLTLDANGIVTGVFNFEPPDGSVDGPYGDIVYLTEGPDGAIYYVDLGYSDISAQFGLSKLRRITYLQSNLPPVVVASATPVPGTLPMPVFFSSDGSFDPEHQPITYFWTFGDGDTSTEANPIHLYTLAGQYTARLAVSDGVSTTQSTPMFISAGNPPSATISQPTDGATFVAGDTIFFSGSGTDQEDGTIPPSGYTWNIDFLHEGHVHPGTPITGITSGSFVIPTSGHDFSGNTRYRIQLTITDSDGLQDVKSVIVWPRKVNINFDSVPTGLGLTVDGVVYTTPFVHDTLTNFTHTIGAPDQVLATSSYAFASWSDGGAATHVVTVPATDSSLTATFTLAQNQIPPGLAAGWSFNEGSGTSAHDSSGNGNTLTLVSGAAWAAGHYSGGLTLTGTPQLIGPNSPSLGLSGSFTLTAWIKPSSLSGYQTIVLKEDTTTGACGYWLQTVGNGVSGGFNNGSGCREHTANASLQTGTWYHVAAVLDTTAHTYSIYVNGLLVNSEAEAATPQPNNQSVMIGRSYWGEYWKGTLDEVRIYNRALGSGEIQVDMNTPLP